MNSPKLLVATLLQAIDDQALSLAEVERRAGLARQTMHHWPAGRWLPKLPAFCKVADALGFDVVLVPRDDGAEP